jgi:hypothetical protein
MGKELPASNHCRGDVLRRAVGVWVEQFVSWRGRVRDRRFKSNPIDRSFLAPIAHL